MIRIGDGWEELAATLATGEGPERVYVVGRTDCGKTTLCRYLVEAAAAQVRTAYVDCDTGQSRLGPPTTEGMVLYPGAPEPPGRPYLRFVGSTSPGGHFVQTLTGAKRLVEMAAELGARVVVIDSPGLVAGGVGTEFQVQMIDLLRPTRIVALQRGRELERILANFARHSGITTHRLPVSPAAVSRPPLGRRRYREERFLAYFAGTTPQEVVLEGLGLQGRVPDLRAPRGVGGRLVSFNDPENFSLALALVREMHPGGRLIEVLAPAFDHAAAASVRFGSLSLDLDAEPGSMESFRP
ncbi:AAA family ATPase [Methanoculleus sp. Wushi-C6]|uniref:polynucleotide 5'-hydroxyl-kinase n=1 Tax=Methanoculleus caldifontis TaxID=2651577 RepID=A0ABU3X1Y4_9EURY|nr:polynucleotide 5'-hydroxyl-kinase [Methanoculleus sp. Wushi-C6]MDV2482068.1 AAA family ATPase [Methanoculleus sp. Wushi-C6]